MRPSRGGAGRKRRTGEESTSLSSASSCCQHLSIGRMEASSSSSLRKSGGRWPLLGLAILVLMALSGPLGVGAQLGGGQFGGRGERERLAPNWRLQQEVTPDGQVVGAEQAVVAPPVAADPKVVEAAPKVVEAAPPAAAADAAPKVVEPAPQVVEAAPPVAKADPPVAAAPPAAEKPAPVEEVKAPGDEAPAAAAPAAPPAPKAEAPAAAAPAAPKAEAPAAAAPAAPKAEAPAAAAPAAGAGAAAPAVPPPKAAAGAAAAPGVPKPKPAAADDADVAAPAVPKPGAVPKPAGAPAAAAGAGAPKAGAAGAVPKPKPKAAAADDADADAPAVDDEDAPDADAPDADADPDAPVKPGTVKKPPIGGTVKPKPPTKPGAGKPKKRADYNPAEMERWRNVPSVEVEVNSYDDIEGAVCSQDSTTCNLRAALVFVGNRAGTIKLPTVEVHKLKRGPILLPQYSHVTITSIGTTAQKKAVIYHRESATFGGGNDAILIVPENTTLTLDSVTFKNNPRRSVYGDRGCTVNVQSCSFVNNTFDAEGTAIKVDYGDVFINDTLFFNNTCMSSGAAVYTTYSNVTVISSNFLNNTANSAAGMKIYRTDLNVSLSSFKGGVAWTDGGGLEMVESTGLVADSIFEGNDASSGGAVKMAGSNVTFDGAVFRRNSCRNTGAAFDTFLSNATIVSCVFTRNHALNVGGALNGYQTLYVLNDTSFELNWAESVGGAVNLLDARLYDTNSIFSNNSAHMGGAFNLDKDGYAKLVNTTLLGNNATGNGASVRILGGHAVMEGCSMTNNTATTGDGSAIFGESGYLDTLGGTFFNHTSNRAPVMELRNMSGTVNGTLFKFNKAKKNCGAVWVENSPMVFADNTFLKNTANKGGAMYVRNYISDQDKDDPDFTPRYMVIQGGAFQENVALDAGGGIEMSQAENVTIRDTLFSKNNATDFGGAVHMEESNATFEGARFEGNEAEFGAAIETFMSEFHADESHFSDNRASWGGAVEFKMSVFECSKSEFVKNRAKFDGGALNCQNSTLDLAKCKFKNNIGENNAGGFWVDGSVMTATECAWEGNAAKSRDGGGIFALNTDSKLRNCVLNRNSARRGANIYNHGGDTAVFCRFISKTYNRPKVNGHINQDCFMCPAGKWGDFENAGSSTCAEECSIETDGRLSCYDCPYEQACKGQRYCKEGYRGEQCMDCKAGHSKLGEQCLPKYAIMGVAAWAVVVAILYGLHLAIGPVLDANQYARLKILSSLVQLLVMVGKVHGAFGGQTEIFVAILQPLSLWLDVTPLQGLAGPALVPYIAVHLVNILLPVVLLLVLLQLQNFLYHRRIYYTSSNVTIALDYLKKERRVAQCTMLMAELSYVPLLYNAARLFYCYNTTKGVNLLVADPSTQCTGAGFGVLRGVSVAVFVFVGVVFPLILRYVVVKLFQQNRMYETSTRELYRAIFESYQYERALYDLVFLLFRALILVPLLAAHAGFAQAMAMMGVTALYYFYYRGNNPFIKFEDNSDVERPNLHYKAEESKLALLTFMLVVAAVGAKAHDMIEICGWVFTLLSAVVLILVIRNFIIGVRNVNEPPTEAAITLAQDSRLMEMAAVHGPSKKAGSSGGHGGGGGQEERKEATSSQPGSRAPSMPPSRAPSVPPSALPSRAPSQAPSRANSRPPSRSVSRQSSRASSPIRGGSSRVEELSRDDLVPPPPPPMMMPPSSMPGSRQPSRPPSTVGSAASSPTSSNNPRSGSTVGAGGAALY